MNIKFQPTLDKYSIILVKHYGMNFFPIKKPWKFNSLFDFSDEAKIDEFKPRIAREFEVNRDCYDELGEAGWKSDIWSIITSETCELTVEEADAVMKKLSDKYDRFYQSFFKSEALVDAFKNFANTIVCTFLPDGASYKLTAKEMSLNPTHPDPYVKMFIDAGKPMKSLSNIIDSIEDFVYSKNQMSITAIPLVKNYYGALVYNENGQYISITLPFSWATLGMSETDPVNFIPEM